jgi:hypothetical protein
MIDHLRVMNERDEDGDPYQCAVPKKRLERKKGKWWINFIPVKRLPHVGHSCGFSPE